MSNEPKTAAAPETERKHPLQRLLDNPWALLVLGVLVASLSYTAWGWFEIATVKDATLP